MKDQVHATPTPHSRVPWNKGKVTGQNRRCDLNTSGRSGPSYRSKAAPRDLAMFNLAIDSKLHGRRIGNGGQVDV
jgi:hypothetical protein